MFGNERLHETTNRNIDAADGCSTLDVCISCSSVTSFDIVIIQYIAIKKRWRICKDQVSFFSIL